VHACLRPTVDLAGPFRLLRVQIDLTRSEAETIGSIGHELWHAIEVLMSDPPVTTQAGMVLFFKQFGGGIRFETAAATKAGADVFYEVRAARNRDRGTRRDSGANAPNRTVTTSLPNSLKLPRARMNRCNAGPVAACAILCVKRYQNTSARN
jgi:hypothetical protein